MIWPPHIYSLWHNMPMEDRCLVHRCLYYVYASPAITDSQYDEMERIAEMVADEDHPLWLPGSDLLSSYPSHVRKMADFLLGNGGC